jgi:ATP-dependent Clp protease ATP-binding subunit ClpA
LRDGAHPAEERVSTSDRDQLRNLERNLKLVIFGQDRRSRRWRLGHQAGALGPWRAAQAGRAFLFAGPTGVGKTEVTRQLATVSASS